MNFIHCLIGFSFRAPSQEIQTTFETKALSYWSKNYNTHEAQQVRKE